MMTSDVHGHVRRTCRGASCYPGAASLASAVRTVRQAASMPVLLIDAGDALFGSSDANETIVGEIMTMLEYDAMVLGNHERDIGPARLHEFATNKINFPILASNADGAPSWLQKHLSVDLGDGIHLCLVGETTAEVNPLAGDNITLRPELDVVKYASQLKRDGTCHHIVIISHGGIVVDQDIGRHRKDVVDAVLGGHSHVMVGVPSDAKPESAEFGEVLALPFPFRSNKTTDDAPIAHVGSYGRYMGLLHLEWTGSELTTAEGNLVPLDERHGVVPAPDIDRWLSEHESVSSGGPHTHIQMDATLGLNDACGFTCRKKECLLGNLVTDAMRSCVVDGGECASFVNDTAKDLPVVAIMESGTLRDCPMSTGEEDFTSILPWPNNLVLMTVTGSTLRKMLEHGVKTQEENGGGFLQTSGLSYHYRRSAIINASIAVGHPRNTSRAALNESVVKMSAVSSPCAPAAVASTLVEPIRDDASYLVVATDWLAVGGDGFGEAIASAQGMTTTNVTLRETILWHASSSPSVQREGRSCFVQPEGPSSSTTRAMSGFVAGYVAFFASYPLYTLFVRKSSNGKDRVRCGCHLFDGVFIGSLATAICQFIYFLIYDLDDLFGYSPFLRSSLGSISTCLSTNPLWVVITRMQTAELSMFRSIQLVQKQRGWQGFFDGVTMNLAMCVFPVVRQVTMEAILATFKVGSSSSSSSVAIAAGLAACVATIVTLPIQRWRVRLQQGMSAREAVTVGADVCDGLAFKVLHSSVNSIVLFVVKANLEDLIFMLPVTD